MQHLIFLLVGLNVITGMVVKDEKAAQGHGLALRIDEATRRKETTLQSYSDLEHYTLHNSRLAKPAEMVVRAGYSTNRGKHFHVISAIGPSILRNRVLKPLLKDEQYRSQSEGKRNSLIISANYRMRIIGKTAIHNQPCYILDLAPKRKTKYLLVGRAWVLQDDYSLVRLEGKTAASVSFWSGKASIVREYEKVDGFWMPKTTQAITANLLTGRSTLVIDHGQYEIVGLSRKAGR